MKSYHVLVICSGLLCILGGSFLLVPSRREVALMHLKDKDYEVARQLYASESTRDDLPVSVVVPLTELYLQDADVRSAIALMERFVHKHPENMSALRRLDQLYRYVQRTEDILANLENICRLQPTDEELRELSNIYNFTSQYARQIEVLKRLVLIQPGNPQNLLDLAYLQASQGLLGEAAETMQRLESRHSRAVNDDSVEFLISLLTDSGRANEAFARARAWILSRRDPDVATRFANMLHFKKKPELALRLLEPLEDHFLKNPPLLAQFIELQTVTGQGEKAYGRLQALNNSGKLPDDLSPAFVDLCLTHRDLATAMATAQRGPLDRLPEGLLVRLGDLSIAANQSAYVGLMFKSLGDGFFTNHPVLAARLASALQDKPAAERWIDVAERRSDLSVDQRVALAGLYVMLGRRERAMGHLMRVVESPNTPDSALHDLARLYLESGDARSGLPVFARLRNSRPSAGIQADWALLSAGAGVAGPVIAWLKENARTPTEQLLLDLYYMGEEKGAPELSVAAAEKLLRRAGGRREHFLLGRALLAAHRPTDALSHLRVLLPGTQEEESIYIDALTAAASKQEKHRGELRDFLAGKLGASGMPQSRREDLIRALLGLRDYKTALPAAAELARKLGGDWFSLYAESAVVAGQKKELCSFLVTELERKDISMAAKEERLHVLLDNGGMAEAIPYLRSFAQKPGSDWSAVYEEALLKLNRRDELFTEWRRQLARQDISAAEKRGIGYRALEAEKSIAEAVFRALASNAAADSPDVSQLLYLWGPRPSVAALGWIEGRARASSGAELARWMKHLLNAGGAKHALAAARNRLPLPGAGGAILDAYMAALSACGDYVELARILEREFPAESSAPRLRSLIRQALETNLARTAKIGLERLLAVAPGDPDTLRQLGLLAFSAANYGPAKSYLSQFLVSGSGDYESHWIFGELMLREGKRELARKHYQRSLQQIGGIVPLSPAARVVRAKLLFRVGRSREALASSESLIAERPDDAGLRADLVAAMLDGGLLEDAKRYLRTRNGAAAPPVAANLGGQNR